MVEKLSPMPEPQTETPELHPGGADAVVDDEVYPEGDVVMPRDIRLNPEVAAAEWADTSPALAEAVRSAFGDIEDVQIRAIDADVGTVAGSVDGAHPLILVAGVGLVAVGLVATSVAAARAALRDAERLRLAT